MKTAFSYTLSLTIIVQCLYASEIKKIVFLSGDDLNHKSGTHEFHAGTKLLKKSLERSPISDQFECVTVNNWPKDVSIFSEADTIVHYYKGNKTHFMNDNAQFIDSLYEKGCGQVFIHYAVDPDTSVNQATLKKWTGGVYIDKVSMNPHWDLDSQLQQHPINTGVNPYKMHDEWYVNIDFDNRVKTGYDRPNIADQVYSVMHGQRGGCKKLESKFKKKTTAGHLTVFWAKENKAGTRGVGITGAHYHKNWTNNEFRKQVLNAVAWASKINIPKSGVTSPAITEAEINENLDPNKKGGLKKISLSEEKEESVSRKKTKTKLYASRDIKTTTKEVHPYFAIENIDTLGTDDLKVGSMHFHGDDLYLATLAPDRTNKSPDREGKILLVTGAIEADGVRSKIKSKTIVEGLYEPTAVTIVNDALYVGTKTQILRFNDFQGKLAPLTPDDAIVIMDGLSTINFHTYTVGFEQFNKDGKIYLCGNFTTAIQMGGKRDYMVPPNPLVKRGSTFLLGPVTGTEAPKDVNIEYLGGGYRTPNGIEVGPDSTVYVADNQGIFNPSNKLIRVKPGGFYGHYLYNDEKSSNPKTRGRSAAFQPNDIDAISGGAIGQTPATVHLPQGSVARSPAQPHVIRDRKGVLAPYNGQILLCEFTTGAMLRVSTEEVNGEWQGVVFKHSGGQHDEKGNGGFTGGPNRIEVGPDGHYYIGQIGAGGLWEYNGRKHGLQRFRVKSADEIPSDFNEILNVKVAEGGFELEFLKPIKRDSIAMDQIKLSQWTYIPKNKYGGSPVGTETLKAKQFQISSDGKKATLLVDGLKDGSDKYIIKEGNYTSDNVGYVVHVDLSTALDNSLKLYEPQFWYTLHNKIGGQDLAADQIVTATAKEQAKIKYESLCISCHAPRGTVWAAPDLKGLLGRKQIVIKNGKEVEVTVDRNYIVNAIINPDSEKVVQYKDAVMAQMGIQKEEAEVLTDYILKLK